MSGLDQIIVESFRNRYEREISRLRDILHNAPCSLFVQDSPEVRLFLGYGDRIMALEIERLRRALRQIANGEVTVSDVAEFADVTLEGTS